MKRVRLHKYTGDLASEMSMEDLLKALSDYLLDSGFQNPYSRFRGTRYTRSTICARPCGGRSKRATSSTSDMQQRIDEMAEEGSSTS